MVLRLLPVRERVSSSASFGVERTFRKAREVHHYNYFDYHNYSCYHNQFKFLYYGIISIAATIAIMIILQVLFLDRAFLLPLSHSFS